MISDATPASWQDLQIEVARLLSECGMEVEIEKKIHTARGVVELDVFAEENVEGRRYKVACECKRWRANVHQQIIHGFRSVIDDCGLNKGYIITTSDFQVCSRAAADYTNIELVTWSQFQSLFEATWLRRFFSATIKSDLSPLMMYAPLNGPSWLMDVPESELDVFCTLTVRYRPLARVAIALWQLGNAGGSQLPLRSDSKFQALEGAPAPILDATSYRELLAVLLDLGRGPAAAYCNLRDRNGFSDRQ